MIDFFWRERNPEQLIYAGENSLRLFRREGRRWQERPPLTGFSLTNMNGELPQAPASEWLALPTGLILNPAHFIFNILEFEKLPFNPRAKQELIEWKLKKVFPENIDQYLHQFVPLDSQRVLSLLLRRNLADRLESLCQQKGMPLISITSSTVVLINNLRRQPRLDFIIETDGALAAIVFLNRSRPLYLRKFTSESAADFAAETLKTVQFVKNSYNLNPQRYIATAADSLLDKEQLAQSLQGANCRELPGPMPTFPFIPDNR